MTNTKVHNIYLIDKTKVLEDPQNTTVSDIVSLIMESNRDFKLQELKPDFNSKGFSISLYFREEKKKISKFSSFCIPFVEENQKAVKFSAKNASSVLFISKRNNIFAITTGQGFRIVDKYAVSDFGLLIASEFQQNFKVTSLDSNAMSSIVHSEKTIYSNEVDFFDVESLDTVFKAIIGKLNHRELVHDLLGLDPDSNKESVKITAKNFLQFSSSLDIYKLLDLLEKILSFDFDNLRDRFNLIKRLTPKNNENEINNNNSTVIRSMYEAINSDTNIPFDLFHKDTIPFISADSYTIYNSNTKVKYAVEEDYVAKEFISKAYKAYLVDSCLEDSEEAFNNFFNLAKLCTKKDDNIATDAPLLKHISGEILVDDKNYYIFYGEYYFLDSNYNQRLRDSLEGKLREEYFTSEIKTLWKEEESEDNFNLNVSNDEDYVHLHKIKPEGIEFCDLLKWEEDQNIVTIVHVKDGFDGEMRILERQVELSILKLRDIERHNNDGYMKNLYANAKENRIGKNISDVFETENDFLRCMRDNNLEIRYVIVLRHPYDNLLDCRSNIAKHCLNSLLLRCFNLGIDLKIRLLKPEK